MIDKKLLNIINKKKIRAQVGGKGGGILGSMIKNKIEGSIITISSIYGLVSPQSSIYEGLSFESEPDYSYNKFAAIGFTKYISSCSPFNQIQRQSYLN